MSDPRLADLLSVAAQVHREQVDKAGEPKILHVIRVVARVRGPSARRVAAVHDALEDSDSLSLAYFRSLGLTLDEIEALDAITRRKDETYRAYIERVARSPIAREVKLADLADNLDPKRDFPGVESLRERYRAAVERLTDPTLDEVLRETGRPVTPRPNEGEKP